MKKLLKLVVVVLVVIVIAAIVAVWKLDALAKTAIEQGGSYALGTKTRVEKVHIGLLSGQASVNQLAVDNPAGFPAEHPLMRTGDLAVHLLTSTLTKPTIVIPRIQLDGLEINLDRANGRYNVQAVSDHLKKISGQKSEEPPAEEKEGKPGKKYVVKELLITNITGKADLPTGMSVPIQIDRITLNDITSDKGVDLRDLIGQLFPAVMGSVVNGIAQLPGDVAQLITGDLAGAAAALGGQAQALLNQGVENIKKQLAGQVEQIGQQAGKVLQSATEGLGQNAGKAVEDVTKDIGNILKGDQDKAGDSSDQQNKDPLKSIGQGLGGLLGGQKDKQ